VCVDHALAAVTDGVVVEWVASHPLRIEGRAVPYWWAHTLNRSVGFRAEVLGVCHEWLDPHGRWQASTLCNSACNASRSSWRVVSLC
jgi:hypothetical protein